MSATQLTLCLLSLSLLCSGSKKDVRVEFEKSSSSFKVYIDDVLWFSSGALGLSHQGKWWSSESADTYILKVTDMQKIKGSGDSIGDFEGMQ